MLSADSSDLRAEPGLFIETGCHIEVGASWRAGGLVADVGVRVPVAGIAWIRPGIEADRRQRTIILPRRPLAPGESRDQMFSRTTIDPVTEVRPRLSFGADIPAGRFRIAPEIEVTRGGALFLSVRLPMGPR
jgi:hypothetical protein